MRPAGIIGLGVSPTQRKAFYATAQQRKTGEDKEFVYLELCIGARVKQRIWTRSGRLWTLVFVEIMIWE